MNINLRAMSSTSDYLVDDPKYDFLKKDLKLERSNAGVYNGKWFGSGPAVKSIGKFGRNYTKNVEIVINFHLKELFF